MKERESLREFGDDDPLADDCMRLLHIAERVLAGEAIESFDLGEYEIYVVVGYCQRGVDLV